MAKGRYLLRVLVTGGAGFIGSHLVEALLEGGAGVAAVRVVDNLSTGRRENLAPFLDRIEFIEGDLLDDALRRRSVAGIDVILHSAALPSVPRSIADPVATHRNGPHLTLLLLEAARRQGVGRLVYASSSSVYGETEELPKVETMPPNPRSPYAASKAACEQYVLAFARCFDLDTVSLRYFNVFGPRQNPASRYSAVIARFCEAFSAGGPPDVHGDGEQSRDFTYVENAVRANLLAMRCDRALEGQAINVACGERHTLNETLEVLGQLSGQGRQPRFGPPRPGDVRHSQADIARAKRVLGYVPTVAFRDGLARTFSWYRREAAGKS